MTDTTLTRTFSPVDFGAAGDGRTIDTVAVQEAIDAAAAVGGRVVVPAGTFLIGSIFLGSDMELTLSEGATLKAVTGDEHYPTIFSRLAGIEMDGPAALVNAIGRRNVRLNGTGTIDGSGQFWWDRYWGPDGTGGVRADYDGRGLRWAADYDTVRPRLVLFHECADVSVSDLSLRRSPFWTLHLCYCTDVHVSGVTIDEGFGPSTDGIDIDSCTRVLVEKCTISCGDDDIVIKSGRDADGLRVGRPACDIEIRDCLILEGEGISLGSDLSGGINDVRISDITFRGTDFGFRLKSSWTRSGVVENIRVTGLDMTDVREPISYTLNWYPWFNAIEIPADYEGEIPAWWHVLALPMPEGAMPTTVRDIHVSNVVSRTSDGYDGPSRAFRLEGYPVHPMTDLSFENLDIQAYEFGQLSGVERVQFSGVAVSAVSPAQDTSGGDHKVHFQWRPRDR